MDIKVKGITREIFEEALSQANKARKEILANMLEAIPEPRADVSKYAPKMDQMKINTDKIKDVIGPGGKMINKIIDECDNVKIDIDDDGSVTVYHMDREAINKAMKRIEEIVREAKVGEIYEAEVVRIENFGAFVRLFGNTDGLLHISKIAHERIDRVEDVLKLGDIVRVKVTEIDDKGKVSVSAKALLPKPEGFKEPSEKSDRYVSRRGNHRPDRRPRNDHPSANRRPRDDHKED